MRKKNKDRSLSSKAVRLTVRNCIIFGLVVQIVALSFYAIALVSQYIKTSDTTLKQLRQSIVNATDSVAYSKQVMEIYQGLLYSGLRQRGRWKDRERLDQSAPGSTQCFL